MARGLSKTEKAGIVIGVLFIVLAFLLYSFIKTDEKEEPKVVPTPVETVTTEKPKVTESPKVEETAKPVEPTQEPQIITKEVTPKEGTVTTEGTMSKQVFSELEEGVLETELGEPIKYETGIAVVTDKKVVLLDYNAVTGSTTGKQFTYAVTLKTISSSDEIEYFISASAYNSLEIGTKLTVGYFVYENKNDVKFFLVDTVERMTVQ